MTNQLPTCRQHCHGATDVAAHSWAVGPDTCVTKKVCLRPGTSAFPPSSPLLPGIQSGMALALSIFGIAFAASCIWLTVRIFNRGDRWAMRTLAAALMMLPLVKW